MKMKSTDYEHLFDSQVELRVNWLVDHMDAIILEKVSSLDGLQALHFRGRTYIDIPENIQKQMALEKMGAYPEQFRKLINKAYANHVMEAFGLDLFINGWKTLQVSIPVKESVNN